MQHTVEWHHQYLIILIAAGDVTLVNCRMGGLHAKRSTAERHFPAFLTNTTLPSEIDSSTSWVCVNMINIHG